MAQSSSGSSLIEDKETGRLRRGLHREESFEDKMLMVGGALSSLSVDVDDVGEEDDEL